MAQPVWVLSVDLQTKTATFQSGMADAAKSARGAFTDIKSGSGDMGREVSGNMMEARHGVMLLGEEFGIHLPRALTTFIASIGPVGALMEAAFPFLAIAVGATLLIQALVKMHEAGEKLTQDQLKFATSVQTAFNSLDEKLLQAGIRADELRNDHLGALKKQLQLINMQSMSELVQQFGLVQKAANIVFADLKSSWYSFNSGSAGAKHSLDEFTAGYTSFLAQGKSKEASELLANKLQREVGILEAQQRVLAAGFKTVSVAPGATSQVANDLKDWNALKDMGVGLSEKDVAAQKELINALNAQVTIEGKVTDLKKANSQNAVTATGKEGAAQSDAAARQAAESTMRINMQALAADKTITDARLTMQRASIQERTQADLNFAAAEMRIQLQGNAALMAALDKGAKDYNNQLKAAKEKAVEIISEHETHVAQITAKGNEEQNAKNLVDLETAMRESIEATQTGTSARITAIDSAIRAENALNLQGTNFYRDLLQQKVENVRQAALEEEKLRAEAGAEAADHEEKMGALILAAAKEHQAVLNSLGHISAEQRVQQETQEANEEFKIKQQAMQQQIAALDKGAKDYENKLKAIQNKETQLARQHENEITAIKEKAEIERNKSIVAAEQAATNSIASSLTQSIMGHQTWAKMVVSLGNEAVTGLIKNSLMVLAQQDKERLGNARTAATSAYKTGEAMGPAGVVLGPVFAAAAFAGVMAFASGTDRVPGVGGGDSVPAMLTPGEGVVPGGVMDGLRNMVRNGGMGGGNTNHLHFRPTYHLHALDGDGMEKVLAKHSNTVSKHVRNELRKLNG